MKVTISLTIKQAAHIMHTAVFGFPVMPEFAELERFRHEKLRNTIPLFDSFETQVLDQITGTRHYDEYKELRTRDMSMKIRGLPWSTQPIFPYSKKHQKQGDKNG